MEFCHSFGKDSSLVVIETEQENNHLKQWLINHGMTKDSNWISELSISFPFSICSIFPKVTLTQGCGWGAQTMDIMASGPGLPLETSSGGGTGALGNLSQVGDFFWRTNLWMLYAFQGRTSTVSMLLVDGLATNGLTFTVTFR